MARGFLHSLRYSFSQLCRQLPLLAGLVLLCALLPALAAPALEGMLSSGTGVRSITVALAGVEGEDETTQTLASYLLSMSDVNEFCQVIPMSEEETLSALEKGEVTAALLLPQGFLPSILDGENKAPVLVLDPERSLESYLALWLSEGAADMLATSQAGIYAVLDLYRADPPAQVPFQQAVLDINLAYLNVILNRSSSFRVQEVSATGLLSVPHHYGLSLLVYLPLLAAPLLAPLFSSRKLLSWNRRLRSVGYPSCLSCLAALTAASCALLPVFLVPMALLAPENLGAALLPCLVCAVWSAAFCALCALLSPSAAGCAVLSFLCATLGLFICGGIIPPVLLPRALQDLAPLLPVTWARRVLALALDYDPMPMALPALVLLSALLAGLCLILFARRVSREEVTG